MKTESTHAKSYAFATGVIWAQSQATPREIEKISDFLSHPQQAMIPFSIGSLLRRQHVRIADARAFCHGVFCQAHDKTMRMGPHDPA